MLPEIPAWFAAFVLVTPPALKWWWGRTLARQIDDPLLPERLQARGRRTGPALVIAAVLLWLVWPGGAAVTIGVMLALHLAAGFPLRRALYQETWSLAAYMAFFARLNVAVFGLWVLIALTPWIVRSAGRFETIAAAGLALFLLAWHRESANVIRRGLRAQPVTDPVLTGRFDALVAAAGLARPRFEYVAMRGGVLANAVALFSLRDPGVLVSDTLLSRFTLDEVTAICAHELAHLEYYTRARLRRMNAATIATIVAAAALTPLTRTVLGDIDTLALVGWPAVMMVILTIRARHRQQNETASDLRAVALTGDADALARALTKLHVIARMPRRADEQREQYATHPSLARRIRDIRAQAGAAEPALDAPITFLDATGEMAATFDATRVSWQQAPGITQVLEYAALVNLRLEVPASGAPSLVAIDRRRQRWQMTPRHEDLAALQTVLDRVDGRLSREVPASVPFWGAARSVTTALGWIGALLAIQLVFSFFLLRDSVPADGGAPFDLTFVTTGLCALAACAMWAFGWFRRRDGRRLRLRWAVPALLVGAVLVTILTDLSGASALNRDMSIAVATTRTTLSGPPAAVFEIPFDVESLRISPHGRIAAVVGKDGERGADGTSRVFHIADARAVLGRIEAGDLVFLDDTRALTWTIGEDTSEIGEVDIPSGTPGWRLPLSGIRAGTLGYQAATNAWTVTGRDANGRLVRATGSVGGNDVRTAAWPAPDGAWTIDGWAATNSSAVAVQNGTSEARVWLSRGAQAPVTLTFGKTTCDSDPASDRRLLCAMHAGGITRIFTLDAEGGSTGGIAVIDAPFQIGRQTAPGWVIGSSNGVPVALRQASRELIQPPATDDEQPPSMLTISGSVLATVTEGDPGARIRVYRLN